MASSPLVDDLAEVAASRAVKTCSVCCMQRRSRDITHSLIKSFSAMCAEDCNKMALI